MELEGQRVLPIDRERAWRALNDPALIQAAIPGCESMEKVGDNEYRITLAATLGPMRTSFRGRLHVEDIDAPRSYTLRFEGEGATAGFVKGSAAVKLSGKDGATVLDYIARAQVGGRLAQIGDRLVRSSAIKLTDDFFAAFEKNVTKG